eukprot:gene11173-13011_t
MSESKKYIGRTAQICNLIAKPELNGTYVIVGSFDSEKERYGVRTLVAPNAVNPVALSLAVKLTSLQFRAEDTFADRFPAASVVQASMLMNDIRPGTILDFSRSPPISVSLMEQIVLIFNQSCLCRGTPSALSNTCEARPSTVIQNDVSIEVPDDGIIEFEDINFDNIFKTSGFGVANARHIAFRRCRFHGSARCGIAVGMRNETCHATFENCLFENSPCDLLVFENAHVTLINCVFRGSHICVEFKGPGRLTAIHCTFHGAVQAPDRVPLFELINCTVKGTLANGITIGNGTTARLQGCRVVGCSGEGIVAQGPKRVTVHIEDCVVTECNMGYLVDMGKVNVTLVNSHAFNNAYHGLHLGNSLNGTVTVNNCTFKNNRGCMDVVKMCGPACPVTIDGVLQPLAFDKNTIKLVLADTEKLATKDFEKNGPCRSGLKSLRAAKKAHGGFVLKDLCCLNCKKPEPKEVKFKACGKCNEVVYCCRECQVAHWKEHKKECGKVEYA